MSADRCQGTSNWNSRWPTRCTADATGEFGGHKFCARHLAGAKRSAAKDKERQQKWAAKRKKDERAHAVAAELGAALHCDVRPHYINFDQGYSEEWVEIQVEDLRGLASE